jgi:tetratricopeptide (TPR) repeat protein
VLEKVNMRFSAVGLLLVLLITICGCSSKEEKIADFVSRGDRLLAEKDPVRALLEYKNALQLDPKHAPAMLRMGRAYLAQREYSKAYSAFQSAVHADPSLDEARLQIATLLVLGKEPQKALDELLQLKDQNANGQQADIIRARALIILNRPQEAVEVLGGVKDVEQNKDANMLLANAKKAIGDFASMEEAAQRWRTLDPKDPSSYLFMAHHAVERGDKERADVELRKMVQVDTSEAGRHILRAQVLERLGLIDVARTAYEELPDQPEMQRARADFWIKQGDREKARQVLQKINASNPADVDSAVKLTQLFADDGKMSSAFELLEKTLQQDLKKPDREKLVLSKATLKARQRQWKEAEDICGKILEGKQGNMDAHLLMGKILLATRKYPEAELHLNQVATARPADEEAQILLTHSLRLNKKDTLALDNLKRAIEANPESSKLRMELVRYHFGRKELDSAIQVLDRGIELDRQNVMFLRTRGELEASLKNYAKAEQDFRKIIEIKPNAPIGYHEMGRLMLSMSKVDEALVWFNQGLTKEDGWQTEAPVIAQIYLSKGDQTAAMGIIQSEVAKRPDSPLAHFYLGQLYKTVGDAAGAEQAFAKAIELSPKWVDPYRGMADLYVRQGKLAEAVTKVEEVSRKNPTAAVQVQLAVLYEHAERYDDAIRVYRELIEKEGQSPALSNNLAYLYAEHSTDPEMLAEAAQLAANALSQQPENANFLDTAAWIAYKQGDNEQAWSHIQEALIRSPDDGPHNLHAAIIAHKRGDMQQALYYLDKTGSQGLDKKLAEKARALKEEWDAAN